MYNMTFKDIHSPAANGSIKGNSDRDCIDGIHFENVVINGKRINGKRIKTIKETAIEVGEHIKNLTVK